MVTVSGTNVRTLARLKVASTHEARKLEIDGGLDLPLVTMLLCATDQLLMCHEAIDYDVDWPEEYGESARARKRAIGRAAPAREL